MNYDALLEDYIQEALEIVSAWDLPDDELPDAVNAQARLMAAIPLDYITAASIPSAYAALQF